MKPGKVNGVVSSFPFRIPVTYRIESQNFDPNDIFTLDNVDWAPLFPKAKDVTPETSIILFKENIDFYVNKYLKYPKTHTNASEQVIVFLELIIENDGNIFAAFGKTGDLPVATISLSIFSNPNGLRQLGSGAYAPTADAGRIFLGKPTAPGFGNLTSGFIEGSNVNITDEMTNMIRAQQQFSGAAKIMQANSDMIEKLTR